ncbi:MAG: hypothetical protein R6V40_00525 [Candidatus Moraniibacteriota bacterium]
MAKSLNVKNCRNYCAKREKKSSDFKKSFSFFDFSISSKFLFFLLIGLIGFSGIFYIFQVNKLATMGYTINEKQQTLDDLKQEKRELEIKVAGLRSVYRFENKEELFEMIEPEKISYIEVESQRPVAMK